MTTNDTKRLTSNSKIRPLPYNPEIAGVFYRAGFIESWGRGWQKICDGFHAAGLPKPTIESKQGGVLVTFQRNNVNIAKSNSTDTQDVAESSQKSVEKSVQKSVEKSVEKIIRAIRDNSQITVKDLTAIVGLSRRGVEKNIKNLQQKGIIRRVGPDKGGHWEIIEPTKPEKDDII